MVRHGAIPTRPVDLTRIVVAGSTGPVAPALTLTRRSAVDLLRVASALCPAA
ncbi:putative leader peptide [Geodermatophilus sp. SYSU D01119]